MSRSAVPSYKELQYIPYTVGLQLHVGQTHIGPTALGQRQIIILICQPSSWMRHVVSLHYNINTINNTHNIFLQYVFINSTHTTEPLYTYNIYNYTYQRHTDYIQVTSGLLLAYSKE